MKPLRPKRQRMTTQHARKMMKAVKINKMRTSFLHACLVGGVAVAAAVVVAAALLLQ